MKKHVLVCQHIHEDGLALLDADPNVTYEIIEDLSEEAMIKHGQNAQGLTVRNAVVTPRVLDNMPKLEILSRHGVGVDAIAVDHASKMGLPVAVAANANAVSVAEHTMMMMLALAKEAKRFDAEMRADNFNVRYDANAVDLYGRTVLILGVGRIGRRVARLCHAFGMRVLGYDPYLSKGEMVNRDVERVEDWKSVIGDVDFVTIHCPKNDETIGLVDRAVMQAMKPTAILVNAARGGLINEADLLQCLRDNEIQGAGVDVFEEEPTSGNNPLLHLPNILVSPHSAATTKEGLRRMAMDVAQNILDHFNGELESEMVYNADAVTLNKR